MVWPLASSSCRFVSAWPQQQQQQQSSSFDWHCPSQDSFASWQKKPQPLPPLGQQLVRARPSVWWVPLEVRELPRCKSPLRLHCCRVRQLLPLRRTVAADSVAVPPADQCTHTPQQLSDGVADPVELVVVGPVPQLVVAATEPRTAEHQMHFHCLTWRELDPSFCKRQPERGSFPWSSIAAVVVEWQSSSLRCRRDVGDRLVVAVVELAELETAAVASLLH